MLEGKHLDKYTSQGILLETTNGTDSGEKDKHSTNFKSSIFFAYVCLSALI